MLEPIVIAGATGFVGRSLIAALGDAQPIIGLSRTSKEPLKGHGNVTWRACNLLRLHDTQKALAGAKIAVYLVHSMTPQATLIQGDFEDVDLMCADNFARAAKACGVKHIVYLTGLIPDEPELSRHLRSRLEVEQTFERCGVPLTTLRAGMIIGPGGSSFQLMSRLVQRLPVIVAPQWTQSKSQAVALSDVVDALTFSLEHPKKSLGTWNLGCPEVLTYREMMAQTAGALGIDKRIVDVPFNASPLSLLGVGMLTGTPRQLVVPLAQSLQHAMVAGDLKMQKIAGIRPTPFKEAVRYALDHAPPAQIARAGRKKSGRAKRPIFFVQRMPMPPDATAHWAANECARWLPKLLSPVIKVESEDTHVYRFCVPGSGTCLLELTFAPEKSSAERQVFYMSGGLLSRVSQLNRGCFEFRSVLNNKYILLAVHDASTQRRWLPYKASQAAFHASIMNLFGRHLRRLSKQAGSARKASRADRPSAN